MDEITDLIYKIYGNIAKKDGEGFDEVVAGCKEYQEMLGYVDNDTVKFDFVPELKYTDAKISVICTLTINGKEYTKTRSTSNISMLVHKEDFVRTGAMVLLDLSAAMYTSSKKIFEEVVAPNQYVNPNVFEAVLKLAARIV